VAIELQIQIFECGKILYYIKCDPICRFPALYLTSHLAGSREAYINNINILAAILYMISG
jgi:hypothetical protein